MKSKVSLYYNVKANIEYRPGRGCNPFGIASPRRKASRRVLTLALCRSTVRPLGRSGLDGEGNIVETVLRRRAFSGSLFVVLVFLVFASLVSAQTSALQGVVKDPQDKVVPGADVTLVNKATAVERSTISDDAGHYQFAQIVPGLYQVRAELSGFKTVVVEDLRLQVDTPTTLDLKFSDVGEISETVVVTAEKLLNKVDASIGNPFNELQIRELPIESRNVVDLLKLQAGVTLDGYVAGSRSDQSNLTLDGIDVNEQQEGTAFQSVLRVTPDSIQEFRVTTTNPNANQGRSSGAQVSLVTKSGTNQFHGNVFEYHRNTVTTANDFFNNRVQGDPDLDGKPGIARPRLLRNLYGGSLGGPIAKDKLFFFFNYEGRKDRKQESVIRTVPLAHLGDGSVRYYNTDDALVTLTKDDLNALFPAVRVNPLAMKVLKEAAQKYPSNDNGAGDQINTGGFRFNAPLPLDWNTYTAKLDYNLNEKHLLALRGNFQWDNSVNGTQQFPDTPSPTAWNHPLGIMASDTWTLTSNMLNTFRYGLTRQAFSTQGDSSSAAISFRDVFSPLAYSRTLNRTTPVHNFTDDFSWTKGSHSIQFGTNLRLIKNSRQSYSGAFDRGIMNVFYYADSGQVVLDPIPDFSDSSQRALQKALAAVIGRYTQYEYDFTYGANGNLMPSGTPSDRTFATEEYDFYGQDTWRVSPSLTLTYGLRWGVNTPVHETQGFEVSPTTGLGNYFELRKAGALKGEPYNEPISIDKSGPFYGKKGYYDQDWKAFSPRVGAAWSPSFDEGVLKAIFGSKRETVIRGGFGVLYDRVGSRLAVSFDLNNTLGFSSYLPITANTFDVSTNPGPLFTGFDQSIRNLPAPGPYLDKLVFPLSQPADGAQRIEQTIDDTLKTPINYSWNLSWGREFPHGLFIEASYIGRAARNLLATRDIMQLNNLVDPKSGMDWYTAAGILEQHRLKGTPVGQMPAIPYFENLFPNYKTSTLGPTQRIYRWVAREDADGYGIPDYTYVQMKIDDAGIIKNAFFQPQYGALATWSSVAYSDYNAFTLTARERYKDVSMDLNYTWSKSMDNASGLQNSGAYAAGFIMNALRPDDAYSVSDFDVAHMINSNWIYALPFGKGKMWLSQAHPVVEGILGGWEVNGIFRWNSGFPAGDPYTDGYWPTNWNLMTPGYRLRDPNAAAVKTPKPYADGSERAPNLFYDPDQAYQSYRNAAAGESGDRNILRAEGYVALDLGIRKSFAMPAEGHKLTFMWDVFNVTNTQRLSNNFAFTGLGVDPFLSEPDPSWYNITNIQGSPRVMQFALRYDF